MDEVKEIIKSCEEYVGAAYASLEVLGATMPQDKNMANLPDTARSLVPYVILYTPGNDDKDTINDINSVRAVLNGSSYWPNSNNHTHLKFTSRCVELTDITKIGNNSTAFSLSDKISVVEGLENFTAVTEIGYGFMAHARVQDTLTAITALPPNLTKIGANFLAGCTVYNAPLIFPDSVTEVGDGFMSGADSFVSELNIGKSTPPADDNSLSTTVETAPIYVTGVDIKGENVDAWYESLPNRKNTPFRNLIGGVWLTYGSVSYSAQPGGVGNIIKYECNSQEEWLNIVAPEGGATADTDLTQIGSVSVQRSQIVGIELPYGITELPNHFLRYCSSFNQAIDLSKITKIGSHFLRACSSFNQPLSFPELTELGGQFMYAATPSEGSMNSPIDMPKVLTIGMSFLYGQTKFNQKINLPLVTEIGHYFLYDALMFNQPINLPELVTLGEQALRANTPGQGSMNSPISMPKVETIGKSFLYNQNKFNQRLDFPELITLGGYILYVATGYPAAMNSPINMPKVQTLGVSFLYNQDNFNQPLDLPELIVVDDYFLYIYDPDKAGTMDSPISMPKVQSIGSSFLRYQEKFNQKLDLPQVTSVGNYFLRIREGRSRFASMNSPILMPKVQTIGMDFMFEQLKFNQEINFPELISIEENALRMTWEDADITSMNSPINLPKVQTIGSSFMLDQYKFNQPLNLPELTSLGNGFLALSETPLGGNMNSPISVPKLSVSNGNFLSYQTKFNQPLNFPALTSIGALLIDCRNYTSTITVPANLIYSNPSSDSLATSNASAPCYVQGIKISGAGAAQFMAKYPNSSTGTWRRKLIRA